MPVADFCGCVNPTYFPFFVFFKFNFRLNARTHTLQVSQTITRGGPRSQIAIPAQGMIEFRDALTDLLEEFGTNDGGLVFWFFLRGRLLCH